jgi:predicted Zn finger-like uncharacterized protein
VAEAIHCPSCTTRYRLRPERLKPVIRRAKCFTCGSVFSVGDVVQRLLTLPAQGITAESAPYPVPAVPHEEVKPAEAPRPPLSLGNPDSAGLEVQERTLVTVPDSLPETKVEASRGYPPEITETTLSGYTSARDAIDKLFGSEPLVGSALKVSPEPNAMDMEATLSALDNTLGASPATPPSAGKGTLGGSPMPAELSEEDLAGPSSSTMRLSHEDLLAALAARPASAPVPAPTPAPAEPTVPLRASDLTAPTEERLPVAPRPMTPRSFAPLPDPPDAGAEMLRLKTGEDIYGGLTMPQLIAWVEEGRILENHLVARQHSENWLEAHKVPGLRPVFERLRRERSGGAPSLDAGIGEIAPKKSLFGGLFGRN